MLDVLLNALLDTLKIIPIMYLVYLLIEYFLHRKREKFLKVVAGTKNTGPLIATGLGLIPQCGFSAVMADFFSKRYITIGSLIAIFIATSDEAIILMFSDYTLIPYLLLLLAVKAVIAIAVGYLVDLIFRKHREAPQGELEEDIRHNRDCACDHEHMAEDEHLHHHEHASNDECKCCTSHIFLHALKHTLEIVIYVLILNIAIGLLIHFLGLEKIGSVIKTGTVLEPLISILIGLIPNCFASVMLVELFASGIINFTSMLAGLIVSTGVSILVLFKKNKNIKENLLILAILIIVGLIVGCVGLLI